LLRKVRLCDRGIQRQRVGRRSPQGKTIQIPLAEIEHLRNELRLVTGLLERIGNEDRIFGPDAETDNAVRMCKVHLDALTSIAEPVVPGFASNSQIQRT